MIINQLYSMTYSTFDRIWSSFISAKLLSRAGLTLHEVQSHLDKEGASDLVVELVFKSVNSPSIFVEAVELGIALLEGGNPIIQKSMYNKLMGKWTVESNWNIVLNINYYNKKLW